MPINSISVEGILSVPEKNNGSLIIFVHGSGSSRKSPRNMFIASFLNNQGFSTLLFDLLTEKEDMIYENRFDIPLLAERIEYATKWIKDQNEFKDFNIGYFGGSTGAAAAIVAAANLELDIKTIVSRGGRPDLAEHYLSKINAPTLLIVGGDDDAVIQLNKSSLSQIKSEKKLEIIPGATHLFEEPGALERAAEIASEWFRDYLVPKGDVEHKKP
ncbi:dienelactone hydrolase family protein [Patescibacteria group bacterium]